MPKERLTAPLSAAHQLPSLMACSGTGIHLQDSSLMRLGLAFGKKSCLGLPLGAFWVRIWSPGHCQLHGMRERMPAGVYNQCKCGLGDPTDLRFP